MSEAATGRFEDGLLGRIDRAEEVEIETRAPDGPVHRTIIWAVVDGDDVFVRSVRGTQGRWYRELMAAGEGALHVEGQRIAVRAVDATDDASVERTSAALSRKYRPGGSLRAMLQPETLPTTVRLEPA
jgi:hypothetical protein